MSITAQFQPAVAQPVAVHTEPTLADLLSRAIPRVTDPFHLRLCDSAIRQHVHDANREPLLEMARLRWCQLNAGAVGPQKPRWS